jgi:hypothetical protein
MVAPGRISQLYHTPAFLSRKIGRKTAQRFSHNLVHYSLLIFWKFFVIIYLQGKERHQVYKIKNFKKIKKKGLTNYFPCDIIKMSRGDEETNLSTTHNRVK